MGDERIREALRARLDGEGYLACAVAFQIAGDLDVASEQIGVAADELDVRLNRCQLGLFGYGPKAEGRHRIVRPAERVEPQLAQVIHDSLVEGQLSCRAAWEIAAALRIPKLEVAAAAEALEIRIVRCQLGAF